MSATASGIPLITNTGNTPAAVLPVSRQMCARYVRANTLIGTTMPTTAPRNGCPCRPDGAITGFVWAATPMKRCFPTTSAPPPAPPPPPALTAKPPPARWTRPTTPAARKSAIRWMQANSPRATPVTPTASAAATSWRMGRRFPLPMCTAMPMPPAPRRRSAPAMRRRAA